MPVVDAWIEQPLKTVSAFLEQFGADGYKDRVKEMFTCNLERNGPQQIPSLNVCQLRNIQPNSLVRFRCMIQDMFGPEFYLDVFDVKKSDSQIINVCGRYTDITITEEGTEIIHDSPNNKTSERHIFYCVPVPGEMDWVKKAHSEMCLMSHSKGQPDVACNGKRRLDDDSDCENMESDDATNNVVNGSANNELHVTSKRSKIDGNSVASNPGNMPVTQSGLNFPLPNETGPAVILKVYDECGESLKLNEIIEVIGVISVDPLLSTFHSDDEMFSAEEMKAHHPPASLVPRIHAINVQKLASINPQVMTQTRLNDHKSAVQQQAPQIRENLLALLEHSLGGDSLAAEYLLCHLLSSVYIRKETVSIGKLPLSLTNVPKDKHFVKPFLDVLQELVTSMFYLPMTLDNMNKLPFIPTKDYEGNRLKSGVLQLADRCHLILDETALEPGQLDVNGVKNLTSLGNLIRWQRVSYDFKYHHQDFNTDIPVLILSEGRSLLPSDVAIPIHMKDEVSLEARYDVIRSFLTPEILDQLRLYLSVIPTLEYQMTEEITKMVQDDFVSCRQHDKESMSVDDFQLLLILARLVSLSYGCTSLTPDVWYKVKQMDDDRKSRLIS